MTPPPLTITPLLPPAPAGKQRVDDRRVLNGIFWVLRTGSPWRDLPARYGPSTTVYNRWNRWSRRGTWTRILTALTEEGWIAQTGQITY